MILGDRLTTDTPTAGRPSLLTGRRTMGTSLVAPPRRTESVRRGPAFAPDVAVTRSEARPTGRPSTAVTTSPGPRRPSARPPPTTATTLAPRPRADTRKPAPPSPPAA